MAAKKKQETAAKERALLAAVVHHYGGVERVNNSFLEDLGERVILDIEHDADGITLRTRIAPPE